MSDSHIIPAAAGYYTLCYLTESQGYSRFPIVAWNYLDDFTYPITAGEIAENIRFILCPDGSVSDLDQGVTWHSVDAWHGDQIHPA